MRNRGSTLCVSGRWFLGAGRPSKPSHHPIVAPSDSPNAPICRAGLLPPAGQAPRATVRNGPHGTGHDHAEAPVSARDREELTPWPPAASEAAAALADLVPARAEAGSRMRFVAVSMAAGPRRSHGRDRRPVRASAPSRPQSPPPPSTSPRPPARRRGHLCPAVPRGGRRGCRAGREPAALRRGPHPGGRRAVHFSDRKYWPCNSAPWDDVRCT